MVRRIQERDVQGQTVLVRVDFNVPMHDGEIADDARIRASMPTITHLLDRSAKVVLATHLGRPDGKVVPSLRLDAVGRRLGDLIGCNVRKLDRCVGPVVEQAIAEGAPGDVILLENLRFRPEEEANDPDFAKQLAEPIDLYVNDAFATVHRAHASTLGVAKLRPAFAGFLMQREVEALSRLTGNPKRPYLAVIGGKKASSKLGALEDLVEKVDGVLIGGGVAFSFLHALGIDVAESIVDLEMIEGIRAITEKAKAAGVKILLPVDVIAATELSADAEARLFPADGIPGGWAGFDIGPATVAAFAEVIQGAGTIVWTGPMGAFEFQAFAEGTAGIADAVASSGAYSVIGGGETGEAVARLGRENGVSYISTGGGACLAFLRGKTLPALEALRC